RENARSPKESDASRPDISGVFWEGLTQLISAIVFPACSLLGHSDSTMLATGNVIIQTGRRDQRRSTSTG
ncbi:hypothetical protein, partial [Arthrobacter sp. NPDC057009]|uniref:hypothetical protein n=1 Tax=Arthrobacter sp. NPDC057009 TaxID=3345996 RepID=UPI0036361198